MNLNENSKNLLIILQRDPEKLKIFNSCKSEQEIYEYIVSLIPNYTIEDFEELKRVLIEENEMEKLSEEEISQVSGGSLSLENIAEILEGYQEGKEISEKICAPIIKFLSKMKSKKE